MQPFAKLLHDNKKGKGKGNCGVFRKSRRWAGPPSLPQHPLYLNSSPFWNSILKCCYNNDKPLLLPLCLLRALTFTAQCAEREGERVAGNLSTTHGQPEVNFAFNRIQFWVDLFLILQDLHSFRSQRSTDLIPEADSDFKPYFKVLSRCSLQFPKRHAESDLSSFPFSKVPQGSIITVQIRIKRARAQDATLERKRVREREGWG